VLLPAGAEAAAMATPTLRALRQTFPAAHITWLVGPRARAVLDGSAWANRIWTLPVRAGATKTARPEARSARKRSFSRLVRRVASERFDTAVLLNDRFRAALLTKRAGIPRRVGYERTGNAMLLTDRLLPLRDRGRLVPLPRVHQYLAFARYLGAASPPTELQLSLRPADDRRAERLLIDAGATDARRPWVLLSAAFDPTHETPWSPAQFAALAEGLIEQYGATVMLPGGPAHHAMREAIQAAAPGDLIDLPGACDDPACLKGIVRRCDLVIVGDTLPRYLAAGFEVPAATLLGRTDPRWNQLDHPAEHTLRAPDGQLRSITPAMVLQAVDHAHGSALRAAASPAATPPQPSA